MDFLAELVMGTFPPDLVITEIVLTSEGFIIVNTSYWLFGGFIFSERDTIIGL